MPGGIVHAKHARRTLQNWSLAGVVLMLFTATFGLGYIVGLIYGYLAPPDLDLENKKTYDEQRIIRWFGEAAGARWIEFWHPYALANPHQGRSHHPFWGTWDRFWYGLKWFVVVSLLLPLVVLIFTSGELALIALAAVLLFWPGVFVGQLHQDAVHIGLDYEVKLRRYLRKRWWGRLLLRFL